MFREKKNKYVSVDDALKKLQVYCAYQERCHSEVRNKLLGLQIYGDDLEIIISRLIEDNYLDEERFARAYARGKFRIKKWGRYKIKTGLKQKAISDYCIRKAMLEIDEEEYIRTLEDLISKKKGNEEINNVQYQKILRWAISRGFESNYVIDALSIYSKR